MRDLLLSLGELCSREKDEALTPSERPTSISIVVPVYNSAPILPELVARLKPVLASLTSYYELILVNDGSQDGSWEVISKLAEENSWISGIGLMRSYGQHNAVLAGIRAARYEVIVTRPVGWN